MRNLKYCSRSCYQAERSKPYVAPKSKICTRCNKSKKIDDFYFVQEGEKGKKRWKHAAACKKCQHLYSYEWRKKYPERARDFVKKNQYKIRRIVLEHYGGKYPKCACCGQKEEKFLQVDHINNDGAIDRRTQGYGSSFYRHIISRKFPKNLQILCANCNQAKSRYGICPHKKHGKN